MSGPSIYFTLPDLSKFKFPPDPLPRIVPSASDEFVFKSPISIPTKLYNDALELKVPVTISLTYLVFVIILNAYNTRRNLKPWKISHTRAFKAFVLTHNFGLILYSGITFLAMLRALRHTWPGINTKNGLAGAADSLCKLHGPRGLGDAITYNTTLNIWEAKNELIRISPESTPQTQDVGRLWNEGLAFWGWLFYISKFYEVVDAFVILAKGKRSPLLQTYHHAGIMLTMWAGIRYMSPPIWLAVFLNSGIHTIMYTYFLLSAINLKVPIAFKRGLTTLQIMQFIVGCSYAAAHLFLKYDIPIRSTYKILHPISSMSSVASSTLSEMSTAVTDIASSPSASLASRFMRFLYRAAGDEGIAENIRDRQGQYLAPEVRSVVEHVQDKFREETHHRTEYTKIDCIDTSGEVWAILINLLYLLPLTFLFMRFFYRAYLAATAPSSSAQDKRRAARQSTVDAARQVNDRFDKAGKKVEKALNKTTDKADAEALKKDLKDMRDGTYKSAKDAKRRVSDRVHDIEERGKDAIDKLANAMDSAKKDTPGSKGHQSGQQSGSPSKKNAAVDDLHQLAERLHHPGMDDYGNGQQSSKERTGADHLHELAERVHHVDRSGTNSKEKSQPGQQTKSAKENSLNPPKGRDSTGNTSNDDNDEDDSGAEAAKGHQSQGATPQKKKKKKNKKKSGGSSMADSPGSLGGDAGNIVKESPAAGTYAQTQS